MPEEEYRKMLALRGDAESTAELIRSEGGEAAAFYGDVSDHETARRMVEFAVETYGRLDILVNNASGLGQGTILTTTESEFDYMTVAKMKGAYNTMHFAAPIMIRQGFGRILNCASGAWTGTPNLCAYSAGNAGVVGLLTEKRKQGNVLAMAIAETVLLTFFAVTLRHPEWKELIILFSVYLVFNGTSLIAIPSTFARYCGIAATVLSAVLFYFGQEAGALANILVGINLIVNGGERVVMTILGGKKKK